MVSTFPEAPSIVRGGVESVAYCLTEGLRSLNEFEIHIIAPCSKHKPGIEQRDGMTLHWLQADKLPGFISYWTSFRKAIHRCLNEIKPDITHFQGSGGWTLGYNAPYVFTIHGIAERDILFQGGPMLSIRKNTIALIERQGRKRSPHTILISPYVSKELGSQIGGKQWNIDNPVTDDFFKVQRARTGPRILYVGRISERKNVIGLLRSFSQLLRIQPSAHLLLAGDAEEPGYRIRCMECVRKLGMEENVQFLGNVDRPTLLEQLSRASCLILISKQETAPMIVMEAMAAGVPVVASNICGLPYMIDDGRTGYLVDPSNEAEIVDRLLKLLSNPVLSAQMGEAAREVAYERFHANVIAQKTLAVYREALGQ
ncbi:MAG: glycosyltransferase family 4 protein [Nitrospira sp.]|nr:glycosyltransferase family 4 protein [Nitrospira sp.]